MSDEKFILRVDENEFTIGDLEDFEDTVGDSLVNVLRPKAVLDDEGNKTFDESGRPVSQVEIPLKALKALIWVIKRREVVGFSLEDARNVRVSALDIDSASGESDPKETNG